MNSPIAYRDILKAFGISPKNKNPRFNPMLWSKVEQAQNNLRQLGIDDEKEIDEITGLALAGCFGILSNLYPF